MKTSVGFFTLFLFALSFSGCVTSHYTNDKGCDCTRRYFTLFGISVKNCSDTPSTVSQSAQAQGQELKVAPLAPAASLRQTTPAQTIEQSIKTTTQALR